MKLFFNLLAREGLISNSSLLEQQAREFLAKVTEEQENRNNKYWTHDVIMGFLEVHKIRVDNGEITAGTLRNIFQAVEGFCVNHDLTYINWKRIGSSLPKAVKKSNDRCPTLEEIRKLAGFPDRRLKPIVYTMVSSGIRVGAWDYLRWKHIKPITNAEYLCWKKKQEEQDIGHNSNIIISSEDETRIIAAQIKVYAGEPEEHYSFITPEAYNSLKDWMDFRVSCGEKVTEESWLMRDIWRTIDVKPQQRAGPGGINGLATCPKKLSEGAIRKLLQRAWIAQGIRDILPEGQKRYDFKSSHGFKKYFTTYCESTGVKESFVQFFTDHKEGSQASYRKPPVELALQEYLKAVEKLTVIDNNSASMQKQVTELTEKSEHQNYVIKGLAAEKEKEGKETKKELERMRELQQQQAEQQTQQAERLAATSTRLEQMSQRYMKAFEIIPTLNYGDARKFVNELLRGLPGQRAYEERQRRKKEVENNTILNED